MDALDLIRENAPTDRQPQAEYEEMALNQVQQDFRHKEEVHELRKLVISYTVAIIKAWLVFLTVVIMLSGLSWDKVMVKEAQTCWDYVLALSFNLTDKVMITLLTATTASIVSIVLITIKWLFPNGR